MSKKSKQLSNPFSTGGGGVHFEAHIQASFVALMLSGGYAPCLPCWPIKKVKLQGKIDDYETDDLVVFVEDTQNEEQRKLLAQIKHSIQMTKGNSILAEVLLAAWNDYNNPRLFERGKDRIALITGPLRATDAHTIPWLLEQARCTETVDDFLSRVQRAKFSSPNSKEKLQVIKEHLTAANQGNEISDDTLYEFLKHFCMIGYDLGTEEGVVLSLLHSHIAQFQPANPQWVWGRLVDFVQSFNQAAGTITPDNLPTDILKAFQQPRASKKFPEAFKIRVATTDWSQHSTLGTPLAWAILIGAWNEKHKSDKAALIQLLKMGTYDNWLEKARDIQPGPDSPLSVKNGIWKINHRIELLEPLGSRIFDQDIDEFKTLAVAALAEPDPAFDVPVEERYVARIRGKITQYSPELRQGIAEGLAILGSHPEVFRNCSQGKIAELCTTVLNEIFASADWLVWGSLNHLLPTLAEAAPETFLRIVEQALQQTPCPFDQIFAQERGGGITGATYITGLLWALEGLAWEEQYLVRVCVALGHLASRDPGGSWCNRPVNSLVTILLPWFPQTLATAEKCTVALQTVLRESPDIAWKVLLKLLPGQLMSSSGSYKPAWRQVVPENWEPKVTDNDYWQQASQYAELAVKEAGDNGNRLAELIDRFDHLPSPAFEQLIAVFTSPTIANFSEEQKRPLWDHLTKFINRHRKFSDADRAMPEEQISKIEVIATVLEPEDPFYRHQYLFANKDWDLHEKMGDFEEQQKKLDERRKAAIVEIFNQQGVDGVVHFAESVISPKQIGLALGEMENTSVDESILPAFLDAPNDLHRELVAGLIWTRHRTQGWQWSDSLDKSEWSPQQRGYFLTCLPFIKETWNRVHKWLGNHEDVYWSTASVWSPQIDADLSIAIEKLITYRRPYSAIHCLYLLNWSHIAVNTEQCFRALLFEKPPAESINSVHASDITGLIKFLQSTPSVNQEDLCKVEWVYLPLLGRHNGNGVRPTALEKRLATEPTFFCEVIRCIFRSENEDPQKKEFTEESRSLAKSAYELLRTWETTPGTQEGDNTFDETHFRHWLQQVKECSAKSGHLTHALYEVGEVLIHTPPDPDGLWIHRTVAETLNEPDAETIRRGFLISKHNSRGAHWVDPTGQADRELAEQFRNKADEVENAGFQRLAATLRELAEMTIRIRSRE